LGVQMAIASSSSLQQLLDVAEGIRHLEAIGQALAFGISVSQMATTSMPLSFRHGQVRDLVIAPAPMTPTLTGSAILDLREWEKLSTVARAKCREVRRQNLASLPARARPTAPH
jgi:hypothetical protein